MGTSFLALDACGLHFHTRPKIKFKKNQKNLKKNIKNNPLKNKTKNKPFSQLFIVSCLLLLLLYIFEEKNPKKSSCNKVLQLLLCNLNPNNKADKLVKVGPIILWPPCMSEI